MSESNATQVILTDDGFKIVSVQATANKVAGDVSDINSNNKLTPSEKIKLKQEYDKDVELYNIDTKQLHSVGLPIAELETAMSNLTKFVTPLFNEMNKTSTIDRDVLNSVFTAFAVVDKNAAQAFVNMVQQVADDAKKAGDDAKVAGDNAQKMGAEAKATGEAAKAAGEAAQKTADEAKAAGEDAKKTASEAKIAGDNAQKTGEEAKTAGEEAKKAAGQAQVDATQAKSDAATAQQKAQSSIDQLSAASTKFDGEITEAKASASKAQSAADNAFSRAQAIGSQASSAIAVQSAATTKAQSTADSAFSQAKTAIDNSKVTSQAVTDLKDGSKLTIAELENGLATKVANSDYASYKTQTDKQIGQMVTNSTFSAYQQTTADLISSKVATKDFSAYQATTAKAISSKVESNDFNTYKTQTANLINDKVSNKDYTSDKKQTADMIDSKVSTTDFTTYKTQTADLISSKVANSDFSTYKTQTANLISSKVDNKQYQSDKTQTADMISQTVTNAVNNINVGGRNYILNSDFYITSGQKNVLSSVEPNEYSGKKITVSVDIEINNLKTIAGSGYTRVGYEASFHASDNSTVYVGVWKTLTKSDIGKSFKYRAISNTYDLTQKTITSINDGNGALGGVYIQGITADSIKVGRPKLEIATKATDWSPAPEDLATNTEFDQLSNAIKLKADSSDVTSQITVATQGIQSEVDNKVSDLNTKISQTDSAWRASVNTLGTTNMVYNGGFAHGVDGWDTQNGKWGWSNQAQDQVQGSNAIQARFTGLTTDTWSNATSKAFLVRSGQKMSIGAIVTPWVLDSDPNKGFGIGLNFYASTDGTGVRNNSYHPEQWIYTTGRQQLKVENITVPDGANSAVVKLYIQRNGGANFTRVQANMTPTLPQFIDGFATATDITASINDINLKVSNSDGSSSQVDINNDTILLDANKIIFNGNTSIQNGTIGTAKIANAAINTAQIADGAINNAKIANAAINNAKIANAAIDGAKIANAAINTAQIADGAINNAKIGHLAVNNAQIADGAINSAKISNAAINTAQIADGAINNAKIANAAINDAKISNLNGNKIIAGSITANKINVDDLIANGINTKTLTAVNLNASTLTTPQLNLGMNGTFTEDFDYTQPTSMFLPKKNKGTLTFNHGVLQSKGDMQTFVNGKWGGMNDNYGFQAGLDNSQWTEVAPGYIKFDLFKQNDIDVAQRTYIDPTGYYYTSRNGIASYLGNILQTSQVQTPSVLAKYIGPMDGQLRLQIAQNGNHYGLQVGSYAGQEAVLSDFIYNSTVSYSPDVHINSTGRLVRSTSASKYKYNIKNPDIETTLGDRLLNVHLATWNDKRAVDSYAEQLSTGKESEKSSIDKFYGLIAEQLRDAGLDMFITYGNNHEIEGIQYDRAWVPLLSVIRRLNDKVNEYELRLSKLEGTNK